MPIRKRIPSRCLGPTPLRYGHYLLDDKGRLLPEIEEIFRMAHDQQCGDLLRPSDQTGIQGDGGVQPQDRFQKRRGGPSL